MNGSNKFHMEKMDLEKREKSRDYFFIPNKRSGYGYLATKSCSEAPTWNFVTMQLQACGYKSSIL